MKTKKKKKETIYYTFTISRRILVKKTIPGIPSVSKKKNTKKKKRKG
jgi:hypothetical protein